MQAGDSIHIRALKASGEAYRWWPATIESIAADHIITLSRIGHTVGGPKGGWVSRFDVRGVYWFDRPYNLAELYLPGGKLKQIYIHIASPASIEGAVLTYTDHELDIISRPGQGVRVVDQEEFVDACHQFGYTPDFQRVCRRAVSEALDLARHWSPLGPPCRRRRQRP